MDIPHRRSINIFVLAMFSMAVVISLRNLPLTATYGLSSTFFYVVAALLFMIPYALVSAELGSGWPKAGGVYIWVKEALGERFGFFAIWMQWFHNMTWYPAMLAFAGAGVAYVFAPKLANDKVYLTTFVLLGFWAITFFNFLGIKISAWVSSFCLFLGTIIPGALLITFALVRIFNGDSTQIELSRSHILPQFHLQNFVFLSGIFLALSGLEVNANLAREIKNPQKNFPRAIFIAVFFSLIILILGSLSIAIVIPQKEISLVAGLLEAFERFLTLFHLSWLMPLMALFIVLGALGELNAWTIAAAKGLFATTEYGSLPPFFHKLNKNNVPTRLLVFQALIVSVAALVFVFLPNVNISYWILSATSAQMYLLMYILLFISALVLRYKKPNVVRSYQIPFKKLGIWVASTVGVLASIFAFLLSFYPPHQFATGNIIIYEAVMILAIIMSCLLPFLIYEFRKPHWKSTVLQEIREDIHKSLH